MDDKELIISLIKDDLVNNKLLNGLMDIGLDPGNYFLHLSETIFNLMDFEDSTVTDDIFTYYLGLVKSVKHVDVSRCPGQLDKLANEIYLELSNIKTCSHASR
jgi:hypothetical protein